MDWIPKFFRRPERLPRFYPIWGLQYMTSILASSPRYLTSLISSGSLIRLGLSLKTLLLGQKMFRATSLYRKLFPTLWTIAWINTYLPTVLKTKTNISVALCFGVMTTNAVFKIQGMLEKLWKNFIWTSSDSTLCFGLGLFFLVFNLVNRLGTISSLYFYCVIYFSFYIRFLLSFSKYKNIEIRMKFFKPSKVFND